MRKVLCVSSWAAFLWKLGSAGNAGGGLLCEPDCSSQGKTWGTHVSETFWTSSRAAGTAGINSQGYFQAALVSPGLHRAPCWLWFQAWATNTHTPFKHECSCLDICTNNPWPQKKEGWLEDWKKNDILYLELNFLLTGTREVKMRTETITSRRLSQVFRFQFSVIFLT